MFKLKFSYKELPFDDFMAIGMDKGAILEMSKVDFVALFSGRRTGFIRLKRVILGGGMMPFLDVKLCLVRKPDNSVSLRVHPVNEKALNIFNLTSDEVKELTENRNKILVKRLSKSFNVKDDFLVQYDPETREFFGMLISDIVLPNKIDGVMLTEEQREQWRSGQVIEVGGNRIRIDLINTSGFAGMVSTIVLDNGGLVRTIPSTRN